MEESSQSADGSRQNKATWSEVKAEAGVDEFRESWLMLVPFISAFVSISLWHCGRLAP